jgi:hypothetical protein
LSLFAVETLNTGFDMAIIYQPLILDYGPLYPRIKRFLLNFIQARSPTSSHCVGGIFYSGFALALTLLASLRYWYATFII